MQQEERTRSNLALDERLHAYLLANEPPEHPLLAELREVTARSTGFKARMQIAPEQGHFLVFLGRLIAARRALEIGTFTGYSSLALALGVPDLRIVTCDASAGWTAVARQFWERGGIAHRIELRLGPAVETLERLAAEKVEPFDLAFVDANKEDYDAYYEGALALVRRGGLVLVDNTLRAGRVADASDNHPSVAPVRALNTKIAADERVDRVILPISDGMTLARKR
jgi:predicted O-methyltransferase YrrM